MAGGFHVHEFPVPIANKPGELICSATANHYNPWGWTPADSPPPGRGSGELYELGDLSGKFGMLTGRTRFFFFFKLNHQFEEIRITEQQ